jgi:hypothetical protein
MSLQDTQIASSIRKDRSANKAVGSIMFDVAFVALANYDTMRWTINGRTYEIARAGFFTGGADVEIPTDGAGTVDAVVALLVAGIMGDVSRTVAAYDSGLQTVVISALTTGTGGNAITLVETTDPSNKALVTAGGVLQGGQASAIKAQARLTKVITTDEVTALAASLDVALGIVDLGGVPNVLFCTRRPAGGAYGLITGMDFNFTLVAGTEYIVSVLDAAALLANTDVIEVVLEA